MRSADADGSDGAERTVEDVVDSWEKHITADVNGVRAVDSRDALFEDIVDEARLLHYRHCWLVTAH